MSATAKHLRPAYVGQLRAVPDTPRRAVLYLRQSTEKEETISDEVQRTAGQDYAERHGIVIVAEVWEQHTGRVWHKRKGVNDAMSWIERGDAEVVLLWKWNRLSRKRLHWAVAEEKVKQLGGEILSATEPTDVTTASGRFSRNMMVDMAEYESDVIGEGWKAAHANRRARGLPAVGGHRYGYTWIRTAGQVERYEINPEQADVTRWIVRAFVDGGGWPGISRDLNRRGVAGPNGEWTRATAAAVIDSGFCAGLLARVPVDADGKKINVPFESRTWDKGAHEPIIDDDTWQQYRGERIRRGKQHPRHINPAHVLAGIIRCGDCDGKATMQRHRRGFVCGAWRASRDVKCVTIREHLVLAGLKTWLATIADDVEQSQPEVQQSQLRIKTDIDIAAREILELDRQMTKLTRQHLLEVVPDSAYEAVRDEIAAEKAKLNERIATAKADQTAIPPDVAAVATDLLESWHRIDVADRRRLLSKLVSTIEIFPGGKGYRSTAVLTPRWNKEKKYVL